MWTNYHTHTHFCDGKESLSATVERALITKLTAVGFSSHASLPFHRPWCMKANRLPAYLAEIETLKKENSNLQIYSGLEIDYIPETISPKDYQHQLDYTIGSIHFVEQFPSGDEWEIDGSHAQFLDGLAQIFGGNIQAAVERYFELTRSMITESSPTIVGHLDKIKIQNQENKFFAESDSWYRKVVLKTIDAIGKSNCIVEVNTRGLYQNKSTTTYPSPWILEEVCERGIPITLSSDAHHPDDLINRFPETAHTLSRIGFKKLRILLDGRWQDVAFDEHGIQQKNITYYPMA
jgi:histidinol-phosphatase (PHP family)